MIYVRQNRGKIKNQLENLMNSNDLNDFYCVSSKAKQNKKKLLSTKKKKKKVKEKKLSNLNN